MNAPEQFRPSFPKVVDSSMLSHFRSCPRKFQLEYTEHWRMPGENIHLAAGKAFAKGLEVTRKAFFVEGFSEHEAIDQGLLALVREYGDVEPPEGNFKSLPNMGAALCEYFEHYGLRTDPIQPYRDESGHPGVEMSFSFELDPELRHPETGEPIIYCGRYDMLGVFQDQLWVVDEKTTNQLGATWSNRWTLRSQFTGYCHGARMYGFPVAGAIVRGMSILKSKFGHAQSIQARPKWECDRWLMQTKRDVWRMIDMWKQGYFDYDLDDACSAYGGCPFMDACKSPQPEKWLRTSFRKEIWDPITHTTQKLDVGEYEPA